MAEKYNRTEADADRKIVKYNAPVKYHNPTELWVNLDLNIRTAAGLNVFGVVAEGDSYDIAGMKTDIIEADGVIRVPLVACWAVHPTSGKEVLEVLEGNRRATAAIELWNDENTPESVRKNLSKIPVMALKDLTEAQKQEIIFDQDTLEFRDSEIVRDIFKLRALGWSYKQIVMGRTTALYRIMTGGKKLASEVRALTDYNERRRKIEVGMHGTIGNGLLDGFQLGAWMQKQIMASYMVRDGLIDGKGPQAPYFNCTVNLSTKVRKLREAMKADGVKFNPMMPLVEGSEFKRVADEIRNKDLGLKPDPNKSPSPKMMGREGINTLDGLLNSRVGKAVLQRVLGNAVPELNDEDMQAATLQTKVQLAEMAQDTLTPEVKKAVEMCLFTLNIEDFQKWLDSNAK